MIGIACHIGSQITTVQPFLDAIDRVLALAQELEGGDPRSRHLDVGGGLGIRYKDEEPPHPDEYGAAIQQALARSEGRGAARARAASSSATPASSLTRVLYVKRSGRKTFVVVDAAMNDLVRPAFYDAHHDIEPVGAAAAGRARDRRDVVGPDLRVVGLPRARAPLPEPPGDLLAVRSAGAYGFAMASNYNARPRAAEVLVDGDRRSRRPPSRDVRGPRPRRDPPRRPPLNAWTVPIGAAGPRLTPLTGRFRTARIGHLLFAGGQPACRDSKARWWPSSPREGRRRGPPCPAGARRVADRRGHRRHRPVRHHRRGATLTAQERADVIRRRGREARGRARSSPAPARTRRTRRSSR